MKYFLKVSIESSKKVESTHYLVPRSVSGGKELDEDYIISASISDDEYGFSILRNRKYIGGFSNKIEPKQIIKIEDDGNTLTFSLTSNKRKVKSYLKHKGDTTVREMDEFYEYIGKPRRTKRLRSRGPLYPTSGMDPDLRDEYARKGGKNE